MSPERGAASPLDREQHRRFLDRYYGWSRSIYDATRRFFLLGREHALRRLLAEPWQSLVEVGVGTGRNLRLLHRARPDARLGGIDASQAMLDYARPRCPFATLEAAFAEDADYAKVLGEPPDRILFSYSLSMVMDPVAALENARRGVAAGGEVLVVDFGDLGGLPGPLAGPLRAWLRTFHVTPLERSLLEVHAREIESGLGDYWVMAALPSTRPTASAPSPGD